MSDQSTIKARCLCGKEIGPDHPSHAKAQVDEFLRESNAIEGVYDDDSLEHARDAWDWLIGHKALTTRLVREVHKILMYNHLYPHERGYFRSVEVRIGSGYGLPFVEVPKAMDKWVKDAMTSVSEPREDGKHIILDHITYEEIHPFVDGNGRTGRMFLNWARVKAGLPLLVIKASEKQKYYSWFK